MKDDDNIGFLMCNLVLKPLGYSLLGLFHVITHPIKCVLDIIIIIIIIMIWYGRLKITQGCYADWKDLIIFIVFIKFLAHVGEKGSIVG